MLEKTGEDSMAWWIFGVKDKLNHAGCKTVTAIVSAM
jgi:hypothetical protein